MATCLQMIQEAAVRVGILQPTTIENVGATAAALKDPDAMVLLGALNETMRQTAVLNLFDPLTKFCEQDVGGSDSGYKCTSVLPADYAGMLSSFFVATYAKADLPHEQYFEHDPDTFSNVWAKGKPIGKNMFRIINSLFWIVDRAGFSGDRKIVHISYAYRSSYAVMQGGDANKLVDTFTLDNDTTHIDRELLVSGTVLNYKAYNGIDYQFDMQKHQNYVSALEKNRQNTNLFRDNSMAVSPQQ
jgi:hypothetical protein